MSLVVLKRKAGTKYGKLSSRGNEGFSLNNPRRIRSRGGKGQLQTPMKGTSYRGHGGCCGTYPINVNKSQHINSDPFERAFVDIKTNTGISVKNHRGSMAIRHKWMKRGYPHYVVKDTTQKTYEQYIADKAAQNAAKELGETAASTLSCEGNGDCSRPVRNIVKKVGPLPQSEYMKTKLMNKNCLPPPNSKLPYPMPVVAHCGTCGQDGQQNTGTESGNCN